jgi:hypothetical protein
VSQSRLPQDLLQSHKTFNRNSAGGWEMFSEHRARVTDLACERPGGTLAVLGAGNCNDLDVERLAASFDAISLIDLDSEALARGLARQPPALAAKLKLHAPVDVTGALSRLGQFRRGEATQANLAQLLEDSVKTVTAALPTGFDVVVSTGLLSQIMHSCRLALGDAPALKDVAHVLALSHLRSLVTLVRPGGRVVLVTDAVSSETYPLEELWTAREPLATLDHLEATDNLFTGTAPAYLRRLFMRDPELSRLCHLPARLVPPWLWRLGEKVTLLAYAFVVDRK